MADEAGTGGISPLMRAAIESARERGRVRESETLAELQAEKRRKQREGRERNLEPFAGHITGDDRDRIIHGELDSVVWKNAVEPFMALFEDHRINFLWLGGSVGVGKTVASLGMLAKHSGFLITADELSRAVSGNNDEARALRTAALKARVLVIDDIGGGDTDGARAAARASQNDAVYKLVNERQSPWKATILTGNATKKEILLFDSRTISRVEGAGIIVEIGGRDLRRQRPKAV